MIRVGHTLCVPKSGALGLMFVASVLFAAPVRAEPADEDARPSAEPTTMPVPGPAATAPPDGPGDADEVTLRDGRRIRGRIVVRDPGRWVVIETEDGHRRTLPWDRVEEIDVAPKGADATVSDAAGRMWKGRSGSGIAYELRGIGIGAVLPAETFGLSGDCATGSGRAPASIYGQTAIDRGRGLGLGLGGRASYMYMSTLDPRRSASWWGLRLGLGLDLSVLYVDSPSGIATTDGELCTSVSKTPHPVDHTARPLVLATIPFHFGAHFAFGSFEEWTWRGVVLGAAWAPSSFHFGPLTDRGSTHFNYLGFELTLDFTTLHAKTPRSRPTPQTRLSAFISVPHDSSQPLVGTLGIGAAWY